MLTALLYTLHVRMATVKGEREAVQDCTHTCISQVFHTQSTFTLGGNVLFPLRITLSVKCICVQQNNITTVQPLSILKMINIAGAVSSSCSLRQNFAIHFEGSYIYVGGVDVVMFTVNTIRNGFQNNTMTIICPNKELKWS